MSPPPLTQACIWEGLMIRPRFPAAEVTSAHQLLLQMCSSFAVCLQTRSPVRCWSSAACQTRSGRSGGMGLCSTCTTFGQSACWRPRLLFKPPICTTWAGQHKPHTSQTQWTYYAYVNAEGLCMFLSGKSQSSSTWKANMLERRLTVYMCIHI